MTCPDDYPVAYWQPRQTNDEWTYSTWLCWGRDGETLQEYAERVADPVHVQGPLQHEPPSRWGTYAPRIRHPSEPLSYEL